MTVAVQDTLLGSDFASVCARHGAPIDCSHAGGVLRLSYRLDDGSVCADAIEMIDGVVVQANGRIVRSDRDGQTRDLVGLPVEDALPRLVREAGRPIRCESFGDTTRFYFERCIVTAHEGTVACIVPRS